MKAVGFLLLILAIIFTSIEIYYGIQARYKYSKEYFSYWSIADKSSTIQKKSEYLDKFVEALKQGNFSGEHNAIWLKTPDNSFDYNFEALLSLQLRLHEIQIMDITSFQYQTAIQQITAQEQGEAKRMLDVFGGIWYKKNYFLFWNWILLINIFIVLCFWGSSGIILLSLWSEGDF